MSGSASASSSRGCRSWCGRSPRSRPGRRGRGRSALPGNHTAATHEVVALGPDRTRVRQVIDQRGPLGALVGLLMRRLTRRYLDLEAAGLKAASEARRPMPRPPDDARRQQAARRPAWPAFARRRRRLLAAEVAEAVGTSHRMLLHRTSGSRTSCCWPWSRRSSAARWPCSTRGPTTPPAPSPPCGPTCAPRAATVRAAVLRVPRPGSRRGEAVHPALLPGAVDGWLEATRSGAGRRPRRRPAGPGRDRGLLLDLVATGDERGRRRRRRRLRGDAAATAPTRTRSAVPARPTSSTGITEVRPRTTRSSIDRLPRHQLEHHARLRGEVRNRIVRPSST